MSFVARVHDPLVSPIARAARYAFIAIPMLFVLFAPGRVPLGFTLATLGVALLAPLLAPHRVPRVARVELAPGLLTFHAAGRVTRITAADLVGASTSDHDGRTALALRTLSRPTGPLVLELTHANANAARAALGIPVGGMGYLSWAVAPSPLRRWLYAGRLLLGVAALAIAAIPHASPSRWLEGPLVFTLLQLLLAAACVAMALTGGFAREEPRIALNATHVTHRDARGHSHLFAYSEILTAAVEHGNVVLTFRDGRAPHVVVAPPSQRRRFGLTAADAALVASQIRDAAARSVLGGTPAIDFGERLEALRQRGEPTRAWLARLDATAASIGAADGYRAVAIDRADLWHALASADADIELRAASARMLLRIEPEVAHTRIAEAIATLHTPADVARVRVSLGQDVDDAANELDAVENADAEATRRARRG